MKKLKSFIYNILQFFISKYKYYFVLDQRQKEKVLSSKYNLTHTLNPDSIVFEVGGYKGDWSAKIAEQYDPNIYIFEPVKSYYDLLVERFEGNLKVRIFNYGLSDKTEFQNIKVSDDGSSLFIDNGVIEKIKLVSFEEFLSESSIAQIDLLQMNIEGGEYALLEHCIDKNLTNKITKLQVQFHKIDDQSEIRRDKIQNALSQTHNKIYDFPFLWESWSLT